MYFRSETGRIVREKREFNNGARATKATRGGQLGLQIASRRLFIIKKGKNVLNAHNFPLNTAENALSAFI